MTLMCEGLRTILDAKQHQVEGLNVLIGADLPTTCAKHAPVRTAGSSDTGAPLNAREVVEHRGDFRVEIYRDAWAADRLQSSCPSSAWQNYNDDCHERRTRFANDSVRVALAQTVPLAVKLYDEKCFKLWLVRSGGVLL